jgi:AsmA protein
MDGMMRSLGGNGSVKMSNGVIKGIDLKNMANNLKSAFTKNDVSGEYTAFSDLNGTFTISQGIVSNKDLILKSPLLSLGGSGEVNLPMQTIHYVLNPEFVSTVKNADGTATKGLQVPIIISGSLDNPHFAPDVVGIVKNTLQNPDALKNTVNSLKEQFKGGKKATIKDVQDLIGGFGL